MATVTELIAWRDELQANIATGVLRVTYMGRTTEFRSLADMQRTLADLNRQIEAQGSGKRPVRIVYAPGRKHL